MASVCWFVVACADEQPNNAGAISMMARAELLKKLREIFIKVIAMRLQGKRLMGRRMRRMERPLASGRLDGSICLLVRGERSEPRLQAD